MHYKLAVDGKLLPRDNDAPGASPGGGGGSGSPLPRPLSPAAAAAKSPAGAAKGCRWTVHVGGGRTCVVEYNFSSMDILLDDIKASVEGEFVEEEEEEDPAAQSGMPRVSGVRYSLLLGPAGVEALLTVIPSESGRGPPEAVLVVNGVIQQQRTSF